MRDGSNKWGLDSWCQGLAETAETAKTMQSVGREEGGPHHTVRLGEVVIGATYGQLVWLHGKQASFIKLSQRWWLGTLSSSAWHSHALQNTSGFTHLSVSSGMKGLTQFSELTKSTTAIIKVHTCRHFAAFKGHSWAFGLVSASQQSGRYLIILI